MVLSSERQQPFESHRCQPLTTELQRRSSNARKIGISKQPLRKEPLRAMAYFQLLRDLHLNYTLNRPLADGEATSRIAEAKALAPKIRDTETWTAAFLEAAQCAEAEARWLDAAAYYHQVEFFLPAGDLRNSYYDDFACTHARGAWKVRRTTSASRYRIPVDISPASASPLTAGSARRSSSMAVTTPLSRSSIRFYGR